MLSYQHNYPPCLVSVSFPSAVVSDCCVILPSQWGNRTGLLYILCPSIAGQHARKRASRGLAQLTRSPGWPLSFLNKCKPHRHHMDEADNSSTSWTRSSASTHSRSSMAAFPPCEMLRWETARLDLNHDIVLSLSLTMLDLCRAATARSFHSTLPYP